MAYEGRQRYTTCDKRTCRLQKEVFNLWKNIKRLTDGQAAMIEEDWDSSRLNNFQIVLKPNDGPYREGSFVFSIKLDGNYPSTKPPFVYCETDIYHPNITSDIELRNFDDIYGEFDLSRDKSNVCLNLLTEGLWNPSFGLESIVLGLLFLLHHPNYDDPLAIEFDGISEEERDENIRKYMAGEEIDGTVYQTDFVVRDGKLISSNSAQHKCTGSENGCSECLDSEDSWYGTQGSQSREDSDQDLHEVCCKRDTNTTSREDLAFSKSFTEAGIMEMNVSKNTPSIEEQETRSTSSSQSEESGEEFGVYAHTRMVKFNESYVLYGGDDIDAEDFVHCEHRGFNSSDSFRRPVQAH